MALTLSQNSDCSLILVTSELLDTAFGGSPDPYTDIKIKSEPKVKEGRDGL